DVDSYDVLGLRRTAAAIQIKARFRQLALLKHPDKNPDSPNATLEFQLLQTAYSTLIDPDRRRDYDE
ncbi:DnaJ domain-containing protein, partial [Schizothecium vesticola]